MTVNVRGRGTLISPAVREHVERRLWFAVGRFEPRIHTVSVHIKDTNGPRGGEDKSCRVSIRLLGGRHLSLEERGQDLYAAVDRMADRIGHAVSREWARLRDHSE